MVGFSSPRIVHLDWLLKYLFDPFIFFCRHAVSLGASTILMKAFALER
jgi:hypothetical protein